MNEGVVMNKPVEESCTWKFEVNCEGCKVKEKLNCRWKLSDLLLFFFIAIPGMTGCLAGTLFIGLTVHAWWPMILYILFFPIVLGIAETRFLCSHCPYYAQKGLVLHCLANHGFLRLWKYHPEPMNKLEKLLMWILILVFLLLIPCSILGFDIIYFTLNIDTYGLVGLISVISLTVVTILSLTAMAFVMIKNVCSVCINFSCPLNGVKKEVVDQYLEKNLEMKKAWEKCGYKIEINKETSKPESKE